MSTESENCCSGNSIGRAILEWSIKILCWAGIAGLVLGILYKIYALIFVFIGIYVIYLIIMFLSSAFFSLLHQQTGKDAYKLIGRLVSTAPIIQFNYAKL